MLRPEIEARVRAFEESMEELGKRIDEAAARSESICQELDAVTSSIDEGDIDGIPVETFDEPSVVEHMQDLDRTTRRVRRESRLVARRR